MGQTFFCMLNLNCSISSSFASNSFCTMCLSCSAAISKRSLAWKSKNTGKKHTVGYGKYFLRPAIWLDLSRLQVFPLKCVVFPLFVCRNVPRLLPFSRQNVLPSFSSQNVPCSSQNPVFFPPKLSWGRGSPLEFVASDVTWMSALHFCQFLNLT